MTGASQEQRGARGPRAWGAMPRTAAAATIAVVFGLLLWAKLVLVTGHPRTAIAEPRKNEPSAAATAPPSGTGSGGVEGEHASAWEPGTE